MLPAAAPRRKWLKASQADNLFWINPLFLKACACMYVCLLTQLEYHAHTHTHAMWSTQKSGISEKRFLCVFLLLTLHFTATLRWWTSALLPILRELIVDSAPVVGRAPMRQRCTLQSFGRNFLETRRVTYPAPHGFHIISETTTVKFYGFLPGKGRRATWPWRRSPAGRSDAHGRRHTRGGRETCSGGSWKFNASGGY